MECNDATAGCLAIAQRRAAGEWQRARRHGDAPRYAVIWPMKCACLASAFMSGLPRVGEC
jgi:hypothetical protein